MGAISLPDRMRRVWHRGQYVAAVREAPERSAHHGRCGIHGEVLKDLVGHDEIETGVFGNIVERTKIEVSIGVRIHGRVRRCDSGHCLPKRLVSARAYVQGSAVRPQQFLELVIYGAYRKIVDRAELSVAFCSPPHEARPGSLSGINHNDSSLRRTGEASLRQRDAGNATNPACDEMLTIVPLPLFIIALPQPAMIFKAGPRPNSAQLHPPRSEAANQ